MNVYISNPKLLEEKIEKIGQDSHKKLHVISDFDRTLTKAFVNGVKTTALIAILRNENYLTEEYSKEAHKLSDKYHTIEIDPKIPLEEKKKAMLEWWTKHFELLIRSKLNKKDIQRVIDSEKSQFRDGAKEFLDKLKDYKIPLVIFSSAGLGAESIERFLEKENRFYRNIHIMSNAFIWDKNGNAIDYKKPVIHVFNKDETSVKEMPFYSKLKNRTNIILLGDSMGDLGMTKGSSPKTLIKVGFLNENTEQELENFLKNYDVVITNDGPMTYVNKMLEKILK